MANESNKREVCPSCGTAGAVVTYAVQRNGEGVVQARFPKAVKCRNPKCRPNDALHAAQQRHGG